MAIVYKITNRANDKSYIGHSVRTLEQRWKSHLSCVRQGSKFRFHSAIRKYGIDQWDKEIIFENIDRIFFENINNRQNTFENILENNFIDPKIFFTEIINIIDISVGKIPMTNDNIFFGNKIIKNKC